MKVLAVYDEENGRTEDLTGHPVGLALAAMVERLRELGDDEDEQIAAVEAACDEASHPLLLDAVDLAGDTLTLHCMDPARESEAGERWLAWQALAALMPDEDCFTVTRAARQADRDPREWLSDAIRRQAAAEDAQRQHLAARQPGPWPGWWWSEDAMGGRAYRAEDGSRIYYMPHGWRERAPWQGPSSRPWSAGTADALLKDKAGRIRTFANMEAAKAALDACS